MFDSFSKAATALRVSVLFLALLCAQGFRPPLRRGPSQKAA
ncbi:MAG: hypothetical protein ACLSHC_04235 [Bilophila wadsworthia]